MNILGLETSCDETAAAVVSDNLIRSSIVLSQLVHQPYGGVVPELASREHIRNIIPIVNQALTAAELTLDQIDGIAVTYGPGLVGALLVGVSFAKALALSRRLPFIGVNHLEGHLFANFLEYPDLKTPFVGLIVSGGHSVLVLVREKGVYQILGQTKDDAAGEAFDKVAKLLGVGYPGGQKIDDLARKGEASKIKFPRAYLEEGSFDFSFSGLKTAVALYVQRLSPVEIDAHLADLCAGFQEAIIDVLVEKSIHAVRQTKVKSLALAGGVARNSRLQQRLKEECRARGLEFVVPSATLCTDNAAMIAATGAFYLTHGKCSDLTLDAVPYVSLKDVNYIPERKETDA